MGRGIIISLLIMIWRIVITPIILIYLTYHWLLATYRGEIVVLSTFPIDDLTDEEDEPPY